MQKSDQNQIWTENNSLIYFSLSSFVKITQCILFNVGGYIDLKEAILMAYCSALMCNRLIISLFLLISFEKNGCCACSVSCSDCVICVDWLWTCSGKNRNYSILPRLQNICWLLLGGGSGYAFIDNKGCFCRRVPASAWSGNWGNSLVACTWSSSIWCWQYSLLFLHISITFSLF